MKILVVDDHAPSRTALADELRSLAVSVEEAPSAATALALIRERCPAAVIVAYPMALPRGGTLTAALRSDPALSRLIVVAHSRWAWRRTRERALEDGCDAFFEAPTAGRVLVEEIGGRLRQRERRWPSRPATLARLTAATAG